MPQSDLDKLTDRQTADGAREVRRTGGARMTEEIVQGGECVECKTWCAKIDGVYSKGVHWLPRRGGLICHACTLRCACGAVVLSLNPFDMATDRVMCQSCVRQRLARVEQQSKMCHGEGCPRADLCRRYMDAPRMAAPTYFLMSPVQHNGDCTEFVSNGWLRKDPTRCGGAHPPPRCTRQCCIEEDN